MNLTQTTTTEQAVARVERERRQIERAAMARLSQVADAALRNAAHALRIGSDPQAAAASAIVGNKALGLPGMIPAITRAMVMADLTGRRRTMLDYRSRAQGLALSAADDEDKCRNCRERKDGETLEEYRKRDKCGCWLLLILGFNGNVMGDLYAQYRPQAERIVQRTAQGMGEAIAEAVNPRRTMTARHPRYQPSARRTRGEATPDTPALRVRRLVDSVARKGLHSANPHRLDTEVAAAVVQKYDAGRMAGTPATTETLWGYHYSAILDNRTTDLCRAFDGTTLPKGDSFWKTFAPPNHFNCRSTVLPVWQSSALRPPASFQPYASVEDIARFVEIKRQFLSYQ